MSTIITHNHYTLRPVAAAENAAVANIIRTVMTEFGAVGEGYSIMDPEVDAMFESYQHRAVYYVLENPEGKLIGCGGIAQLAGAEPEICELKKMYFLPEARGLGWGKTLIEVLEQAALALGYRQMYLETIAAMQQANGLYKRMGFQALPAQMGSTGHSACGLFYIKSLT